MECSNIVVLLLVVTAPVFVFAYEPNFPMETYTLDLDDPPRTRWNHILNSFNSSVPVIMKYYYDEVWYGMVCLVIILVNSACMPGSTGVVEYEAQSYQIQTLSHL